MKNVTDIGDERGRTSWRFLDAKSAVEPLK